MGPAPGAGDPMLRGHGATMQGRACPGGHTAARPPAYQSGDVHHAAWAVMWAAWRRPARGQPQSAPGGFGPTPFRRLQSKAQGQFSLPFTSCGIGARPAPLLRPACRATARSAHSAVIMRLTAPRIGLEGRGNDTRGAGKPVGGSIQDVAQIGGRFLGWRNAETMPVQLATHASRRRVQHRCGKKWPPPSCSLWSVLQI
jgi:hypothetical protein